MDYTEEDFNTNNSWGFGGGIGVCRVYENGYYYRKGRAYFRHLPSQSFFHFYSPEGRDVSREEFEKATGYNE